MYPIVVGSLFLSVRVNILSIAPCNADPGIGGHTATMQGPSITPTAAPLLCTHKAQ